MAPDTPTPLQLATRARVACAALEGQIGRRHLRKALATTRALWDRIGEMAGVIEQLRDEVDALNYIASLAPPVNVPSIQILPDPGEPEPEWTVTTDVPDDAPPVIVRLDQRPPGFDRVRRRMKEGSPLSGIAAIQAAPGEDDPRPRGKKKNSAYHVAEWRNGTQREMGPPWQRITRAYLDGRLSDGQLVATHELRALCNVHAPAVEGMQMDLSIHRAPLRLICEGPGRYRVRAA